MSDYEPYDLAGATSNNGNRVALIDPYADVPPPDEPPTASDPRTAHEMRVDDELRTLRARDEARRRYRAEQVGAHNERPKPLTLTELLALPEEDESYLVTGLWPTNGRFMLNAQFKAGKTTLTGNLVRCLVDGDDFLGRFTVERRARRVIVVDTELSPNMLRNWLADQRIANTDNVVVYPLRGRVASFDLVDATARGEWAAELRALNADVLILDCLRPVLDALGLDENTDAGRFLVAFDALLAEAGITEAGIVHHMGHSGERGRGSSRLRDWPDTEWKIVRQSTEVDDPSAPRYFSAYGRDVNVPESELGYNAANRHLTLIGGSRKDTAAREALEAVYEYLTEQPRQSGKQIETALKTAHGQKDVRAALKLGEREGCLLVERPNKRDTFYSRNPTSSPRQNLVNEV